MEKRYKDALFTVLDNMRGQGLTDSYKPLSAEATNRLIRFIELVLTTEGDLQDITNEVNNFSNK